MKYEKPLVMDLSARSADGANHVDVCFPGATADKVNLNSCSQGTGPSWGEDCVGGGAPSPYSGPPYCAPGSGPGTGNGCYAGTSAGLCNSGTQATPGTDFGCTVGPSYVGT